MTIGTTTTPPDRRPYRRMCDPGAERNTLSPDGARRQLWRQVGWQGQTGALYSLDERPQDYERGSYAPMFVMVDSWDVE